MTVAPQNDILNSLSEADQNLLIVTPAAVFRIAAGADGTIDQKELHEFNRLMSSIQGPPDDLLPVIAQRLGKLPNQKILDIFAQFQTKRLNELSVLAQAGRLARRLLRHEDALDFVSDMEALAYNITEASGAWRPLAGRTSEEEKAAVKRIGVLLREGVEIENRAPQQP